MKFFALVLILACNYAFGGDWCNWRGGSYNGSSNEVELPDSWSMSENLLWVKTLAGRGAATPVVCAGKVFVASTDAKDPKKVLALCLDTSTGDEVWRKSFTTDGKKISRNGTLAVPSPVCDGKVVYFLFGSGDLAALTIDGKMLWHRNIEKEHGNISIKFGYSSSPLIYDGKLYVQIVRRQRAYREPKAGEPLDSFILAIDAATGKNIWKKQRKTDAVDEAQDAYSTPVLFTNGPKTLIGVNGADFVTAYDPVSGDVVWEYEYAAEKKKNWRQVSSLVIGDGIIYGVRARGSGLYALTTAGKQLWTFDGPTPDSPTPLYYNGLLYVLAGRAKTLTCLDGNTGQQKWQEKLPGSSTYYASLTAGDGKIYGINEEGLAVVIRAGGEKFELLGEFEMGGKPSLASIAIADSKLFIRTDKKIFCVGK